MSTKPLRYKEGIKASISIGEDLIIPYNSSQVFSEIVGDEVYILIKDTKDPSKQIKLFFKNNVNIDGEELTETL
jgi:hypothetical protein